MQAHRKDTIVGEGSEMDNLRSEANLLNIRENVIFTGVRYDIPEIFQVLDIYLLPSLSEGLPMGLLESMAAGCPIIASQVGGIPNVAGNNKVIFLVEPKNVEMLSDKIITLLQNTELQKKIKLGALEIFNNRFSAHRMAKRYMEIYSII